MNDVTMEPKKRLRLLSQIASEVEMDSKFALKKYFAAGNEMQRMINTYLREGNLINAYQLQMKYLTLFLDKIPNHPEYASYSKRERQANMELIQLNIGKTNETKRKLLDKFENEFEEAKKARNQDSSSSSASIRLAKSGDGITFDKKQSVKKSTPLSVEEPISVRDIDYPEVEDAEFDSSKEHTLCLPKIIKPEMPLVPSSSSSTSTRKTNRAEINKPIIDRSLKPELKPLLSPLSNGSNEKRVVILPVELVARFSQYSKSNTDRNIETCAILAGKLEFNKLIVTHMIFPKQTGSSDSCSAENEEEIFCYQDAHELITIGWIHTHPSQTAFLSSIDMHTQFSYQVMMPEAIAVVVAPRDGNRYFSLTNNGMNIVSICRRDGFHSHGPGRLYKRADHVVEDNVELFTADLRNL